MNAHEASAKLDVLVPRIAEVVATWSCCGLEMRERTHADVLELDRQYDMANIDRADWHYGGKYPQGLPPENGGTHIGIYLAWIINRDLGSDELQEYAGDRLQSLRRREISGRDILLSDLDEKFFSSLLSDEALLFTRDYYESDRYVQDYADLLSGDLESLYHVADSWENYDTVAQRLDERFAEWRRSHAV